MRSSRPSNKLEEGKPKNDEVIREIHQVAEANGLRLKHLELAIANLTSICSALRKDAGSTGAISMSVQGGSVRKVQTDANETKLESTRSSSSGKELKDQMLGFQMQQLVDHAAALGIFKGTKVTNTKVSGNTKNLQPRTMVATKNVQATITQKSSTKPQVQTKVSTAQNKLGAVKSVGATKTKAKSSPANAVKIKSPTTTAKVSLKATVKKTETTISEVVVTNKNKETSRSNITVRSSVQNVKTIERKGSIKLRIQGGQGDKSQNAIKLRDMGKRGSSSGAVTMANPDLKPRRRWSTTKEIRVVK